MTSVTATPPTFAEYLRHAVTFAMEAYESGADKGALKRRLLRLRQSVHANWTATTSEQFMREYIFCVGSIQKPYARRMDDTRGPSYWERQLALLTQRTGSQRLRR